MAHSPWRWMFHTVENLYYFQKKLSMLFSHWWKSLRKPLFKNGRCFFPTGTKRTLIQCVSKKLIFFKFFLTQNYWLYTPGKTYTVYVYHIHVQYMIYSIRHTAQGTEYTVFNTPGVYDIHSSFLNYSHPVLSICDSFETLK